MTERKKLSTFNRTTLVKVLEILDSSNAGEALAAVFASQPTLRGYVLDDQGALRRHVNVYVRGEPVRDRTRLSDPVGPDDDIYVLQALTGG